MPLALREAEECEWQQTRGKEATEALAKVLGLEMVPRRIEGFDISNIKGKHAVGSMVVFVDGKPRTSHYRRFRIRTVFQSDDTAMMAEVIRRRYSGSLAQRLPAPDLILVDGGRGQLSATRAVLKELGLGQIPTFALAEKEEELYLETKPEPIQLPQDSMALQLLQQVRDEAHRFALDYHRLLRRTSSLKSELDQEPGIGTKRRSALMSQFCSFSKIRAASLEDLLSVPA